MGPNRALVLRGGFAGTMAGVCETRQTKTKRTKWGDDIHFEISNQLTTLKGV